MQLVDAILNYCAKTPSNSSAGGGTPMSFLTRITCLNRTVILYYAFLRITAKINSYFNLYCVITRWVILNTDNLILGWNSCAEALPNVITSTKVFLNLRKMQK